MIFRYEDGAFVQSHINTDEKETANYTKKKEPSQDEKPKNFNLFSRKARKEPDV